MNKETGASVRAIGASDFQAQCLKLMDEIAETGQEIVISKNGRLIAKLVPYGKRLETLFGIDAGKIEILGDVVGPLDIAWEADQ